MAGTEEGRERKTSSLEHEMEKWPWGLRKLPLPLLQRARGPRKAGMGTEAKTRGRRYGHWPCLPHLTCQLCLMSLYFAVLTCNGTMTAPPIP